MSKGRKKFDPVVYQIKIKGHLEESWAEWFEEMTFTHEKDGTTTLYGPLPDQTALHSILRKVRDLNLQLISVNQVKADPGDEIKTNSNGGVHIDD
jgi:hypothetical protein